MIILIQPWRTGVIERWARPLHVAHIAHFLPGYAVEQRTEFAHFIPDLLVTGVMHRIAHFAGQQADNFPIAFHITCGRNSLFETLEAAVGAGKDAAVLAPGRRRQQHVSHFRRFGHKNILHHHEIQRLHPFAYQTQIGLGLQRILAHDVVGFDFSCQRFMWDFGDTSADLRIHQRRIDAPGIGEFGAHHGVGDVLIARELVG